MTDDRPPAIVLANGLNGLCTVRSLGVAGVPVWAIVEGLRQPCVRSRYCRVMLREADESLVQVLHRLERTHGVRHGVLLATSDSGAQEIAAARAHLCDGLVYAGPEQAIVDLLMDKRREIVAVQSVTDCLPLSLAQLPADADTLLAEIPLPVIFKPRTQELADLLHMKNRVVTTADQLRTFYREFAGDLDSFVAQEVVPGGDATIWQCNAIFNRDSTLVSAFTFQKLGMAPPHYGVTTLGICTHNPEVKQLTQEIGRAIDYVGPAGFEFKLDSRDQRYKYIEINPRFAMANYFDTCCGVNTALRTYQLARGEHDARTRTQDEGAYFLDLYADSYSRLVDDGERLSSVLKRYAGMLGSRRIPAYWSWRDPMPGVTAAMRRTGQIARAVRKRLSVSVSGVSGTS